MLAAAYALAGADCVDVAADVAIAAAAREGINWAIERAVAWEKSISRPWLMVSINDGEDPHFRKAAFDAAGCLAGCSQPCVAVCPADAIAFSHPTSAGDGVIESRCYGCGRCLPICPIDHIQAHPYVSKPATIAAELFPQVDAVEIHTQIGRSQDFERLWQAIKPWLHHLQAVSISCPDGEGSLHYLWQIYEIVRSAPLPIIWQTDGRPMSGDIGAGTTHAAIRYAQKVLAAGPPGFVQLAGGTNFHTVPRLRDLNLLGGDSIRPKQSVAGIAYGSSARTQLMSPLNQFATFLNADFSEFDKSKHLPPCSSLGDRFTVDSLLWEAMTLAKELVDPIKLAPEVSMTQFT